MAIGISISDIDFRKDADGTARLQLEIYSDYKSAAPLRSTLWFTLQGVKSEEEAVSMAIDRLEDAAGELLRVCADYKRSL